MNDFMLVLAIVTTVSTAVVGGVLFAFSGFVMKALARIPAESGIAAMQAINITVQSWLCSLLFFGTALTSAILAVWAALNWGEPATGYFLAGGLFYVLAGIGVTGAFNVPWNNRLAKVEANSEQGRALWRRFVPAWLAWNHVRTIACLAASVSFLMGLLHL